MFYTIVKSFSRADGDSWASYCNWRGIDFERFDSIDGLLRPSVFEPVTKEDWSHVILEDYKCHYITDSDYACRKHQEIGLHSILLGVSFDEQEEDNPGFLGYDLIDGYLDVSLLTNWGNTCEIINQNLSLCGLILSYEVVYEIKKYLTKFHGEDSHVADCSIVSIYSVVH